MKTTSPALKAAFAARTPLLRSALYTFTLASGTVLRYTDYQTSVTVGGHLFTASYLDSAPGFKLGKTRISVGLKVDTYALAILFDQSTRILGQTPGAFVGAGGTDGAQVVVDTLFMPAPGDLSLGTMNRCAGIMDVVRIKTTRVEATLSSPIVQLNGAFPRNYALPQCNHALFDSGCTLSKAAFGVNGTTTSGASQIKFTASALTQPAKYFAQGSVLWLTGPNAGIQSQVTTYGAGGVFTLTYPLPARPTAGDTFTAYPGCSKTRAACQQTNPAIGPAFNNIIHFRGYPYVPTPESLLIGGKSSIPPDDAGGGTGSGGGGVGRGPGGAYGTTAAK